MGKKREPKRIRRQRENARAVHEFQRAIESLHLAPGVVRMSSANIAVPVGQEHMIPQHIESDARIRSGLCPNGCGLMQLNEYGQECPSCPFSTNQPPDKETAQ